MLAIAFSSPAVSQVKADGSVTVPPYALPYSGFASAEARQSFAERMRRPAAPTPQPGDELGWRRLTDEQLAPAAAAAAHRYGVVIRPDRIAGVQVEVIEPVGGVRPTNRHRVLVNLHGGAFSAGAVVAGRIESIPVAFALGIRVIAVNYRQGPEFAFPAASVDVAKVYRALLRTYRAKNIGLFGSSAGGVLTAQSTAWLIKMHLPRPAAIAILCAGAMGWGSGDSVHTAFPELGQGTVGSTSRDLMFDTSYMKNVDHRDALAAPGDDLPTLARFPPTLVLTGTRDFAMSAAVETARRLGLARVPVELTIWDGMEHYWYSHQDLPEARAAVNRLARFFDERLGRRS